MAVIPLPHIANLSSLQAKLYSDFRIEIPCIQWKDRQFVRVSIQGYNDWSDMEALLVALKRSL